MSAPLEETAENFVSVVMPCYNHGRFISESAASILRQTHTRLELIIIDDGSMDESRDVIREIARSDVRVTFAFHDANMGASSSRNEGVRMAKGEFICFCDADDLWTPNKLSVQLDALGRSDGYDVAYCDAIIIDENGAETGKRFSNMFPLPRDSSGRLFEELCLRNFINMQTVMLRRRCLRSTVLFDTRVKWVEDWLCWMNLSARQLFLYTEEPLARYRVHGQSTNITQRRGIEANRYKVFARALKSYPELSRRIKCQIWYHMAASLTKVGRPKAARRHLRQAVSTSFASWNAAPYGFRALARLVSGCIDRPIVSAATFL